MVISLSTQCCPADPIQPGSAGAEGVHPIWIRTSSTRARSIWLSPLFLPPKAREGSVRPLSFRTALRPASKRRGPDRRGRNPCRRHTAPILAWSGKKTGQQGRDQQGKASHVDETEAALARAPALH